MPVVAGPVPQQVYVWQRQWSPAVCSAVSQRASRFDGLVVLAAEVAWSDKQPRVARVPINYRALAAANKHVGLAIRVGRYAGSFEAEAPAGRLLAALAEDVLSAARGEGLEVSELQIDFDAGTAQLQGYGRWVTALKAVAGQTPVTVTALPSWMDGTGFAALADSADGYVLQVHSLARPASPGERFVLCDVARARRWVDRAAHFGRPFRVALPTYGYRLAFDAEGRFLGLSADGSPRGWPVGVKLRRIEADPAAMAGLLAEWTRNRPALMTGVLWYRLPVAGERLNWPWPTLRAVSAGRVPQPKLHVRLERSAEGLTEVCLHNTGDAPASLNRDVKLRWVSAGEPLADAIGGYRLTRPGPGRIGMEPTEALATQRLRPNEERTIGWLRFQQDMEVYVDDETETPDH